MCKNCLPFRENGCSHDHSEEYEHPTDESHELGAYLKTPISRRGLLKAVGGGMAAAMTAGMLGWDAARAKAPELPYVVLIVMDGARQEYLNLSGLTNIHSLMRNGTQYTNAFTGILESETPSGHVT